ncbi:GlcNAc-PI de-N-acetylase [Bosea lathyri]|uniref:GlcNAc-PI de-N-acetylase n=2 Tax=Bosea lathyri TaxID=1036778 RepID=A0A1H6D4P8_9HYPH|nr:GlcNAc-PI de-N-acetylase [Bosea lathyri]
MLTTKAKKPALFLFPHQDDEFAVFSLLEQNVRNGIRNICVYLTDGGGNSASPIARDAESQSVLAKLGIAKEDIIIFGGAERVPDGKLVDAMDRTFSELVDRFGPADIGTVYAPAWEGGHPDHDAATLIASAFAKQFPDVDVWQFPLYNSYRVGIVPFRVFNPIPGNGDIVRVPFSGSAIGRYLGYCLAYRTQRKTFAALLPFVALSFMLDRSQMLQSLNHDRLSSKPHDGDMLYERRRWLTWEQFKARAASFVSR